MTTQEKFVKRLEDLASILGVDCANDRGWANTGTLRFTPSDSFAHLVSVHYQFNDAYASFDVMDSAGAELIPKPGGVGYCRYDDTFEAQIARIEEIVRERIAATVAA
jgi:hypothetical protein